MSRINLCAFVLGWAMVILIVRVLLWALTEATWWWLAIGLSGVVVAHVGMRMAVLLSRRWTRVGVGVGVLMCLALFRLPSEPQGSAALAGTLRFVSVTFLFTTAPLFLNLIPAACFTWLLRALQKAKREQRSNDTEAH
jgi:hypothetical protein